MLSSVIVALLQVVQPSPFPTAYAVLRAEHRRQPDAVFDGAVSSNDTIVQRLAARALRRLETKSLAPTAARLLTSPAVSVRREAINALAQMGAPIPFASLLTSERNGEVRGAVYESIGRTIPTPARGSVSALPADVIEALTLGLAEPNANARLGAARGLESAVRRAGRGARVPEETIAAMRGAFQVRATPENSSADTEIRQLLLLALTASADRDSLVGALGMRDTSAQVRRLAVAYTRQWLDDPSPLVTVQALRVAGTCARATAQLHHVDQHVALTAIDILGEKSCSGELLDSLVQHGADWRVQAHAVVSLARVDPIRAKRLLPRVMQNPTWQARAYAATAAKILKDSVSMRVLARDVNPNVALIAISTNDEALRALLSSHAGLVAAGANFFKGNAALRTVTPQLLASLFRLTALKRATVRDPRMALLQRIDESHDSATIAKLEPLRSDIDPAVASAAARIISAHSATPRAPVTTRYTPPPFPTAATLTSLRGAKARITMKQLGAIELTLDPDEAPATVATFAELATRGAYAGTTWHRIVPVFVVQGGSPGADEFDGATSSFMRDEVGLSRHTRGTFGISTRGRDTGDGQLFINLVDNFRLDHEYTVFGRITRGLDVMDRIQEGDVIESVTIIRLKR